MKEQQEKDQCILLNDLQRTRLAAKAKRLTRELLEATTVLFTPDTILGWYRKLIAQKYDGSENGKNPGRPRVSQEITDLVIRFKKENPHWGYTRIKDYIVYLGYPRQTRTAMVPTRLDGPGDLPPTETSRLRVLLPSPQRLFPTRARPVSATVTENRERLHTQKFDSILTAAGVQPVKLPPRSPNLNSHAERFVRSVREEGLDHLILSSEEQLRYVLAEYLQYYHHERIHQGINKIIEPQHEGHQGEIICIERLGGLLKSYHRKAA